MNTNKPRNREHRTKSVSSASQMTIHARISREAYDQMKDLERRKLYTREQIFLLGLHAAETN